MSVVIRDLKDLTDSREMLDAKAPPFVAIFVYLLLALLLAALVWAYYGERDVVVKTAGIVRPNAQISTVKSQVSGVAKLVGYEAGEHVEQGQTLVTLRADELERQRGVLSGQIAKKVKELQALSLFKASVETGKDRFTAETQSSEAYAQYRKYVVDQKQVSDEAAKYGADMRKAEGENDYNLDSARQQAETLTTSLEGLKLLAQSIREAHNEFADRDDLYARRYIAYEIHAGQLKSAVEQKRQQFETSSALGSDLVAAKQLEDEQRAWSTAQLELDSYRNETLAAIETEIQSDSDKLESLRLLLVKKNYDPEVAAAGKAQLETAALKLKRDKLAELAAQIKAGETEVAQLREQSAAVELSLGDYVIKAPMSGIVNAVDEIREGDLVASGTELLTILPVHDSQFTVRLTVQNKDIAEIHVGDTIKYHFPALPYKEYGELRGIVTKIATDASYDQQAGQSYYSVEATIDNKPLYSYKGEPASIKVGMVCEAYVVTKSQKILNFLLEKLDLRE